MIMTALPFVEHLPKTTHHTRALYAASHRILMLALGGRWYCSILHVQKQRLRLDNVPKNPWLQSGKVKMITPFCSVHKPILWSTYLLMKSLIFLWWWRKVSLCLPGAWGCITSSCALYATLFLPCHGLHQASSGKLQRVNWCKKQSGNF